MQIWWIGFRQLEDFKHNEDNEFDCEYDFYEK